MDEKEKEALLYKIDLVKAKLARKKAQLDANQRKLNQELKIFKELEESLNLVECEIHGYNGLESTLNVLGIKMEEEDDE